VSEEWSVSRVHPADLLTVWHRLLPQIRQGLRKGAGDTLSERGLFSGVASGRLDLWVIHDGDEVLAGMFLRIDERERGKALIVLNVVGRDFKRYAKTMVPRLRDYGDLIGAYTIESVSRPGAARLLTRLGCKPKAVIMELGHGR